MYIIYIYIYPRAALTIVDTLNNRSCKTILVKNLNSFHFRQCFTVSFKFSSIFLILFFSIKIRILRNFQSIFTFIVDTFPSCKDMQSADQWSAVGREKNMDTIIDILCCTWPTIFSLQ